MKSEPVKGLFHRENIPFPFLARCHGYPSSEASMLNIKIKLEIHISNRCTNVVSNLTTGA